MSEELTSKVKIKSARSVTTNDGISFVIDTSDCIELSESQYNDIKSEVLRKKARYIVKDGIDIVDLDQHQTLAVLDKIHSIIGDSETPLADDLIRLTKHVSDEHANNTELLKKRNWDSESLDNLYSDIESVVKNALVVEKAKLKFDAATKKTHARFTFKIIGSKTREEEEGRLSIAFMETDTESVLVVTIL